MKHSLTATLFATATTMLWGCGIDLDGVLTGPEGAAVSRVKEGDCIILERRELDNQMTIRARKLGSKHPECTNEWSSSNDLRDLAGGSLTP